jgi:hypothetical protein
VNTRTKLLTAGIATLALTGGVGASLASADTPSPAPSSSPSTSAAPSPDQKADKKASKKADKKHRSLQARALHGEATVGGAKKQRVVDFQRGTVTKVSTSSITVKSADGFTATYAVDAKTKVRVDKEPGKISEVKAADRVRVVATEDGSTATAKSIADRGAKR